MARAGRGLLVPDSFGRIVRLGEGIERTGHLSLAAVDRTLAALAACAERLARWQPTTLSAIATEACRPARGRVFLARVRAETGIPVTVVSTREETELAVESCVPLPRLSCEKWGSRLFLSPSIAERGEL